MVTPALIKNVSFLHQGFFQYSLKIFIHSLCVCIYASSVCMYTMCVPGTHGGQKKASGHLVLERAVSCHTSAGN